MPGPSLQPLGRRRKRPETRAGTLGRISGGRAADGVGIFRDIFPKCRQFAKDWSCFLVHLTKKVYTAFSRLELCGVALDFYAGCVVYW